MKSRNVNVKPILFPKIEDNRGNLSYIEGLKHLPFRVARVYWIYDVPGGERHGGHAYYHQEECIIALSGSFDVCIEEKGHKQCYSLNRSYNGLYIPAGTWRSLENFSTNALCLVLSSGRYDPQEYIRDYAQYVDMKAKGLLRQEAWRENLLMPEQAKKTALQKKTSVDDCRLLELSSHHERDGHLTAINAGVETSFDIERIYYIYDIPYGTHRGGHAHKGLTQWVISAGSCFDVCLDDGRQRKTFRLDRPNMALEIGPGIWRELNGFASGAVVLVLASDYYNEADYIRDYESFKHYRACL